MQLLRGQLLLQERILHLLLLEIMMMLLLLLRPELLLLLLLLLLLELQIALLLLLLLELQIALLLLLLLLLLLPLREAELRRDRVEELAELHLGRELLPDLSQGPFPALGRRQVLPVVQGLLPCCCWGCSWGCRSRGRGCSSCCCCCWGCCCPWLLLLGLQQLLQLLLQVLSDQMIWMLLLLLLLLLLRTAALVQLVLLLLLVQLVLLLLLLLLPSWFSLLLLLLLKMLINAMKFFTKSLDVAWIGHKQWMRHCNEGLRSQTNAPSAMQWMTCTHLKPSFSNSTVDDLSQLIGLLRVAALESAMAEQQQQQQQEVQRQPSRGSSLHRFAATPLAQMAVI